MGAAEVEAFLSWLANRRGASASTHRQALAALVFLYKQVLGVDLPGQEEIGRPRPAQRLPMVMSRMEVRQLLAAATGEYQLVFRLLYGKHCEDAWPLVRSICIVGALGLVRIDRFALFFKWDGDTRRENLPARKLAPPASGD